MTKSKEAKRQNMIYKTLHRRLKIKQHEPYQTSGVNASALEG